MKWLRAPIVLALLGPACSLLARDDGYFDGSPGSGGSSSTGGGSDAAGAGATPDPGSAGTGSGALSGAGGSGAMSGAAGSPNGGVSGSSGEAGAASGAGGESGAGAAGAAGASGANGCDRPDACTAGSSETTMQACGACGTGKQSHTHTCSPDTCTWGPWSDWTTCTGVTATCTPGDTSPCTNGDSCGQRVCSTSCAWGACTPKVAGGCLRIGEGHTNEGSNYRCCARGKWEFCLPSCQWSGDCVSCSEGAPNYCSDCYP